MVLANMVPSINIIPIVPHQMRLRYPNTTDGRLATLSSRFCIFPLLLFAKYSSFTTSRPEPSDKSDCQRNQTPHDSPRSEDRRDEKERGRESCQERPDTRA